MEYSLAGRAVLVAGLAVATLAVPAQAEAGGGLLAGSPRIETVRALIPREGRHAGRLVVWVRVAHASGTRRAVARELPETIHRARVTARVGEASRTATQHIELDRRRAPGGYHFRFPRSALAAQAGRRVPVSVRVQQTIDLDSDGDSDDRVLTSARRNVPLARPALSIEPSDGEYENGAYDSLQVGGGYVTSFFFMSGTNSPCAVGPAGVVRAPIDPQTGQFSFESTNAQSNPPVNTTAKGTFTDTTSLTLDASLMAGSCTYDVSPTEFSFLL